MLKKIVFAAALFAGAAVAQENTDISGANFQSGSADGTLAALGRSAAASGKRLVITAPPEWHAKIAAKVKAGGAADVVLRNGFYENVLVRVESKAEAAAAAKPADDRSKADADKARAEAEKARAEAERMKAEAEKAKAEAEAAKSRADAEKARADAEAARARAEAEKAQQAQAAAAAAATAKAAPAPAPVAREDAVRERMQKSLIEGREARGELAVGRLQPGDAIYVDGAVRGVVRREGNRPALYWLSGDLDLRRTELKVVGTNHYQVVSEIRGEPTLRREFSTASVDAREPAANAQARAALEKSVNDGRGIDATIEPSKLRTGDVIYVNGDTVAVVRRSGGDLLRFWLVGSLDLQQSGLQADGANKYKVLSDTLR